MDLAQYRSVPHATGHLSMFDGVDYIKDRLILTKGKRVSGSDMYADYARWATTNARAVVSGSAFGVFMGKNLHKRRTNMGSVYDDVSLAP